MKPPGKEKTDDIIVKTLKGKYFDLLAKENYPKTTDLTKEIDNLEQAIKELERKKDNYA